MDGTCPILGLPCCWNYNIISYEAIQSIIRVCTYSTFFRDTQSSIYEFSIV